MSCRGFEDLEGRRVLRRGSKKGLSRMNSEGRNTPLREYDPPSGALYFWGSPKASHIKASQPHFPRFPRCRSAEPLFSWGGRDVLIFRIFPVSGLNRWFRKSDRPALGWRKWLLESSAFRSAPGSPPPRPPQPSSLKTVTSLNKESRLLHFPIS